MIYPGTVFFLPLSVSRTDLAGAVEEKNEQTPEISVFFFLFA